MPRKVKSSQIVTFTVPPEVKELLESVSFTGYYESLSQFLRDAIRLHLNTHPELRTLLVFHRYKAKKISIGKASVALGSSIEQTEMMFKALEE